MRRATRGFDLRNLSEQFLRRRDAWDKGEKFGKVVGEAWLYFVEGNAALKEFFQ